MNATDQTGATMFNATVLITRNGEILEEDVATGNTKRTALAAGHALGASIAREYDGAGYCVKIGAISEMRGPQEVSR